MALSFFLLTDFGTTDPYVAQMKGVLNTLTPQYSIYDLTHNIQPHNIGQAAFYLDSTIDHLPPHSVTICVVDPGVGTSRDLLCMVIQNKAVLAPDNGCLSFLRQSHPNAPVYRISQENLPLEHTRHSCTFHGRTIFSPLAADIALHIEQTPAYTECVPPAPFSKNSTQDCRLEPYPPQPEHSKSILTNYMDSSGHVLTNAIVTIPESMAQLVDNTIETQVLHIDIFGNVILALPSTRWSSPIECGGELTLHTQAIRPLTFISAYAALKPDQVGIICGSQGYLELACNMKSAAEIINLKLGDTIRISLSHPPET